MRRRISQPRPGPALVAALLALAFAGPAPAGATGWVDATPPSPAANGPSGAVVAVDPAGDAVAAWTGDDGAGTQSLLVAWRPAGGPWGAPQPLARRTGVDAPAVTLDASGNATVVWIDSGDGATFSAHAARRDAASGNWSVPHDFPAAGAADPRTQVRADANGNVIAAWLEHDASTSVAFVRAAVWSAGTWSLPATLSDPSDAWVADAPPQIAPDASGGALVAWTAQHLAAPYDNAIQTATHLGAGTWSGIGTLLPDTSDALSPVRLAGLEGGDVAASWTEGAGPELMGGYRPAGGAWSVDPLSADVAPACVPLQALGADAGGGATVVWKAASTSGLEAMRLTVGGPEADGTAFASATESAEDAAIDRGTVVFVAHDAAFNTDNVLAVHRDGGGWSAPAVLQAAGAGTLLADPQLATNAAGDQLASWIATDALGAKSVAAALQAADRPSIGGGVPPTTTTTTSPPPSPTAPAPTPVGDKGSLLPLVLGARNGVLTLARGSRTLRLRVRNPNGVTLRGRAALTRPRAGRRAALTLASRRGLSFPPRRRTTVTLRLSDAALRALKRAPGHRLRVILTLRLSSADGRRLNVRAALTLDAAPRFGARAIRPSARTAC
ncbi:MAG: hypothetical protein ACTHOE_04140 [Conexibacter sp.]